MKLLRNTDRKGRTLNLLERSPDIEDREYLSKFFSIIEFNPKFSGGKNSISFNGSNYLKPNSEIEIECIDSEGNSLYLELAKVQNTPYKEATAFIVSIHVYDQNANGNGSLIFWGTSKTGKSVRWIGNINIDKNLVNVSKLRFKKRPTIEVLPIQLPVLNESAPPKLTNPAILTGSFKGSSTLPPQDTSKITIDYGNVDVDYRLDFNNPILGIEQNATSSFNRQMEGFPITLYINEIQKPQSYNYIPVNLTSSHIVKEVLNDRTLKLTTPFYYSDFNNEKKSITNISSGSFNIEYPYIAYNTESTKFLSIKVNDIPTEIRDSYAEITYNNLTTFSGYVARHKIYRKSLFSGGDFLTIADEPLGETELLRDRVTLNKNFDLIGHFYNQFHIDAYYLTSSTDNGLFLSHSSYPLIDSMNVQFNDYSNVDGTQYIIIKNDTVTGSFRTSNYVPYQESEFLAFSGSSFDSNFIKLRKDVQYILSSKLIMDKTGNENSNAKINFYFTTSFSDAVKETLYIPGKGIKIGEVNFSESVSKKYLTDGINSLFKVNNDLIGTLVIVPEYCGFTISELSLKTYGDKGFSPDSLTSRIPFPVTLPNEAFEIKAELFDINHNLVYSDLRTVESFDPSGSTLLVYIPGFSTQDPSKVSFISGSLEISESLIVGESLLVEDQIFAPNIDEIGYDRLVGWKEDDGRLVKTNIEQVTIDDRYITVVTASDDVSHTKRAIAVENDGITKGRRIEWKSDVKIQSDRNNTNPYSTLKFK